jgi:hypothetical protein
MTNITINYDLNQVLYYHLHRFIVLPSKGIISYNDENILNHHHPYGQSLVVALFLWDITTTLHYDEWLKFQLNLLKIFHT